MIQVDFGKTGLRVSRLSIGTGTHGWGHRSEQTALGLDGLANLLRQGFDQGINFWDSADQYGSHAHAARALQGLSRDDVVIATKTSSHSARDIARDIERFLRELKTDVLDIVLLHCVSRSDWPQRYAGAMEALSRAQEHGHVRALGISCHNIDALRTAAVTDWAQVVLARINYEGTNMDATPTQVVPVLDQLHAAGKAIYGMKTLGCGRLVGNVPSAIEYVLRLGTVHAITIGVSKQEHLQENAKWVNELAPRYPPRAQS